MQTFNIWCKKRNDQSDWRCMAYAPRSYDECEQMIDYYEEKWGHFYSYKIQSV